MTRSKKYGLVALGLAAVVLFGAAALLGKGALSHYYVMKGGAARDLESAFPYYDRAIRLDPDNEWAYISRGINYAGWGRYQEAKDDFTVAIQLDPTNPSPYLERAIAYEQLGDSTLALADYRYFLTLETDATLRDIAQERINDLEGQLP